MMKLLPANAPTNNASLKGNCHSKIRTSMRQCCYFIITGYSMGADPIHDQGQLGPPFISPSPSHPHSALPSSSSSCGEKRETKSLVRMRMWGEEDNKVLFPHMLEWWFRSHLSKALIRHNKVSTQTPFGLRVMWVRDNSVSHLLLQGLWFLTLLQPHHLRDR